MQDFCKRSPQEEIKQRASLFTYDNAANAIINIYKQV